MRMNSFLFCFVRFTADKFEVYVENTIKLLQYYLGKIKEIKMTSEKNAQIGQAREAFQMLYQISQLLGTGLDAESLTTCIRLCELGVDPEALAHVIKQLRKMGTTTQESKPSIFES